MDNSLEKRACTSCGSTHLIRDLRAGEEICSNCGLVVSEILVDARPEWRAFTESERKSRSRADLSASITSFDNDLSTYFYGFIDGRGKKLDYMTLGKMNRLRKYDNRTKVVDTQKRNLSIAMSELDRLSTAIHLPSPIKKRAALIYWKALKMDLIRGRSIDAFVAASIYAACREQQIPRSLKGITEASKRMHSEISRSYRLLINELKIKMPIDNPMKFVPSIADKLNLGRDTEKHAINILRFARDNKGLSGKEPKGIAAAALYKACKDTKVKRLQKEVAIAAGTTEVTLRNRLKGLDAILNG